VPLVAGIFEMPYLRFQFANFTSAFLWAAVLLTLGDVIGRFIDYFWPA
jgi:membrane protein DedA with SNARE-associated domain